MLEDLLVLKTCVTSWNDLFHSGYKLSVGKLIKTFFPTLGPVSWSLFIVYRSHYVYHLLLRREQMIGFKSIRGLPIMHLLPMRMRCTVVLKAAGGHTKYSLQLLILTPALFNASLFNFCSSNACDTFFSLSQLLNFLY